MKEKMKAIWNEHKVAICIAGTVVVGATIAVVTKTKAPVVKAVETLSFTKSANPMFPIEMPIAEIKEIASKMEGMRILDAVILVDQIKGNSHLIVR